MAAIKRLFSRKPARQTDCYSPTRDSSDSDSSGCDSSSTDSSTSAGDLEMPPKRKRLLKRWTRKTNDLGSATTSAEPKSPTAASPTSWPILETTWPSTATRANAAGEWSFAALDQTPRSLEDVNIFPPGAWTEDAPEAESSSGAQRRLQKAPLQQKNSNRSNYWKRLSAGTSKWTTIPTTNPDSTEYRGAGLRGSGISMKQPEHAPQDWENFRPSDDYTTSPRPRDSIELYRNRLIRWSESSPLPTAELPGNLDEPGAGLGIVDESEQEHRLRERSEGSTDAADYEDAAESFEDRTRLDELEGHLWQVLEDFSGSGPSENPVDSAGGIKTLRTQGYLRNPEHLRQLEEALKQIDEKIMSMMQDLIKKCDEEGANVNEKAAALAQAEMRALDAVGDDIRSEILRLKDTVKRTDAPLPSANQQEELDRQHAIQLQEALDLEHEELQVQSVQNSSRDCTVCAEAKPPIDFPLTPPTDRCQHPPNICHECLQFWITSQLESKGSTHIQCPECPQRLDHEDVREAASEETFLSFDNLATRGALGQLDEFAWCLRSGCGNGQLNIENNHFMICSACGYQQCLRHQTAWHAGETCEQYDYRVSGRQAEDEARQRREIEDLSRRQDEVAARRKVREESKTAAMIANVSKACPANCGRRIQRTRGCDHMTCRCGWSFCWLCLASHDRIEREGNTAHLPSCPNHSDNVG